ncbi:hypothetical protein CSUB01_05340 [Colletotrichum sublineola]|uniref:Uncharacterized protein n=1 Tax=Colletotrichum sublineola TaxID=1173701 RepID=A0A066XJP1_COLSU|nr:hypothetical protein CSUB01_05340 [Colletotrichum sublineola]
MAEPSYSRDELVSELTSYYEFLTQIYLPPEVIQYPPEGGWEHITPEFVKSFCLGKNDTVTDLMRHIPYIRRTKEDDWDPWEIYGKATAVDFTSDIVLELPTKYANESLFEPEEGYVSDIPPHVFVYATIPCGFHGRYIFIDTKRGTIIVADPQNGPKPTPLSDPIAVDRKHVICGQDPDTPEAQIYREEGLFTERYDRERCMDRLDERRERKYGGIWEDQGYESLPPPTDAPTL